MVPDKSFFDGGGNEGVDLMFLFLLYQPSDFVEGGQILQRVDVVVEIILSVVNSCLEKSGGVLLGRGGYEVREVVIDFYSGVGIEEIIGR